MAKREGMRRIVAAAAVATAVTATLAVPGPAHAAVTRTYIVPTRHGSIFLEVAHPSADGKTPVVLTYSPYSALGRNDDAGRWTGLGMARASADVVGTGNSGGCYDYGGKREKETAYDLVEWIAAQPWSTGKVGMIGGSYDGTTAIAAAVTRPPHLTTIVPEAAISRWYDYAFSTGVRYTVNNEKPADEGIDTPLAFDFGLAIPPPTDPTDPDWQERVVSSIKPCDEVQHTQYGYSTTPDYDAFWQERDYAKDAGQVTIPVLVAHNWGDWNVKQDTGLRFWRGLTKSKVRKLYLGSRYDGHGVPDRAEFDEAVGEWMERWLKGTRNGIERTLPDVISQQSDKKGRGDWYEGPHPKISKLRLYPAQAPTGAPYGWSLATKKPGGEASVSFVPTGSVTETGALSAPRAGNGWVWFESPLLKRDVRIFGSPKLRLWSTTQRTWITVAASVVDIDPDAYTEAGGQRFADNPRSSYGVTRAWLDTRYLASLASRRPWTPGANAVNATAKPTDWTFLAGHSIGLLVSTEELDWMFAKAYDGTPVDPTVVIDAAGKSWLDLPVVGSTKKLF